MARTYKRRTDEIEEFNDDALRMQEADSLEQSVTFSLEDDDVQTLELGDRSRRSFDRLNDRELFSYRD
ncbi:MAG: hypothetical protein K0Q91_203 [Fibrobacteria bacterium]|jgi:hypothetical protein|nr:hypothetical protein [Fibrobacteria bacterium]